MLLMATKFKVCATTDGTHVACISGSKIEGPEVKGIQQIMSVTVLICWVNSADSAGEMHVSCRSQFSLCILLML